MIAVVLEGEKRSEMSRIYNKSVTSKFKMNIIRYIKKIKSENIISISGVFFALIFSGINLCRDINQNKKITEINYKINSINYQPRVKIANFPKIGRIWFSDTLHIDLRKFVKINKNDSIIPTIEIAPKLKIGFKYKIINIGNSLAKLIAVMYGDTSTDVYFLRERILSRIDKINQKDLFPPYSRNQILPNATDTMEVSLSEEIQFINDQKFTIHILLLYKNELNYFYDSYYCYQFKIKELFFPNPFIRKKDKIYFDPNKLKIKIANKDLLPINNSTFSFKNYSEKESKIFNNKINSIFNLIKDLNQPSTGLNPPQ